MTAEGNLANLSFHLSYQGWLDFSIRRSSNQNKSYLGSNLPSESVDVIICSSALILCIQVLNDESSTQKPCH